MTSEPLPPLLEQPGGRLLIDPVDPGTLRVTGEVDVAVVEEFAHQFDVGRSGLARVLRESGVRAVDLSLATYVDSAVIGLLAGLASQLGGQRLRTTGATGIPLTALEITGVLPLLELQ